MTHSTGGGGGFRDPIKEEADHRPGPTRDRDLTGSDPRPGRDYDLFSIDMIYIIYIYYYYHYNYNDNDANPSQRRIHFITSSGFATIFHFFFVSGWIHSHHIVRICNFATIFHHCFIRRLLKIRLQFQ